MQMAGYYIEISTLDMLKAWKVVSSSSSWSYLQETLWNVSKY